MEKLNGVVETHYENGQLEERTNYKNGKLDGLLERWNKDGNLVESTTYKNGEVVE